MNQKKMLLILSIFSITSVNNSHGMKLRFKLGDTIQDYNTIIRTLTPETVKKAAELYAKIKHDSPRTELTVPEGTKSEKDNFRKIARKELLQLLQKYKKEKTNKHKKDIKSKYLPYVTQNKDNRRFSCALCIKEKKKRIPKNYKSPGDICRHLRDVHAIDLGYRTLNKARANFSHLKRTENGQYKCPKCGLTKGDPRLVNKHFKKCQIQIPLIKKCQIQIPLKKRNFGAIRPQPTPKNAANKNNTADRTSGPLKLENQLKGTHKKRKRERTNGQDYPKKKKQKVSHDK